MFTSWGKDSIKEENLREKTEKILLEWLGESSTLKTEGKDA